MPSSKTARSKTKKVPSQKRASPAGSTELSPLSPFAKREVRLEMPHLGAMSPGMAWIFDKPKLEESADGEMFTVIGNNMAGLWFVLAQDGTIHLVDDCEREYGEVIFPSLAAFAQEIARQNS